MKREEKQVGGIVRRGRGRKFTALNFSRLYPLALLLKNMLDE